MKFKRNIFKILIITLFVVLLTAQTASAGTNQKRCDCVGNDLATYGSSVDTKQICTYLQTTHDPISDTCDLPIFPLFSTDDNYDCGKVSASAIAQTALDYVTAKFGGNQGANWKFIGAPSCIDSANHTSPNPNAPKPKSTSESATKPNNTANTKGGCFDDNGTQVCRLDNPLDAQYTPTELIGLAIKAALGVAGALSLFFFIEGGIKWWQSFGNPEKINEGMKSMLWATLGLVVVFLSYAVTKWIIDLLVTGKT